MHFVDYLSIVTSLITIFVIVKAGAGIKRELLHAKTERLGLSRRIEVLRYTIEAAGLKMPPAYDADDDPSPAALEDQERPSLSPDGPR